jgi:hypothetical protein
VKQRGLFQPVAKHEEEEISKYFYKNHQQVVLSAKQKKIEPFEVYFTTSEKN